MFHINYLIFAEERKDRNLHECRSDSQGRRTCNRSTIFSAHTSSFNWFIRLITILLHIRILWLTD